MPVVRDPALGHRGLLLGYVANDVRADSELKTSQLRQGPTRALPRTKSSCLPRGCFHTIFDHRDFVHSQLRASLRRTAVSATASRLISIGFRQECLPLVRGASRFHVGGMAAGTPAPRS